MRSGEKSVRTCNASPALAAYVAGLWQSLRMAGISPSEVTGGGRRNPGPGRSPGA